MLWSRSCVYTPTPTSPCPGNGKGSSHPRLLDSWYGQRMGNDGYSLMRILWSTMLRSGASPGMQVIRSHDAIMLRHGKSSLLAVSLGSLARAISAHMIQILVSAA